MEESKRGISYTSKKIYLEELLLLGRDLGEIQECWDKCSGCVYFRYGPKSKYDLTQVGTCNYQGIKDCVKEEDSNG